MLEAVDLCVEFGGQSVLSGACLCVSPGEVVGLVGANGSGKSTLLRALKGALQGVRGEVRVDGRKRAAFSPAIGLILSNPEDQGVAPVVEDDVAFGLENASLPGPEIKRRVESALRRVGMWEQRKRASQYLSGGEGQLVAIASILALGARYLLLDEAASMLSPWDRDTIYRLVKGLAVDGVGSVIVTHRGEELLWADRIVEMEAGRCHPRGSADQFFNSGAGVCWEEPVFCVVCRELRNTGQIPPDHTEVVTWMRKHLN